MNDQFVLATTTKLFSRYANLIVPGMGEDVAHDWAASILHRSRKTTSAVELLHRIESGVVRGEFPAFLKKEARKRARRSQGSRWQPLHDVGQIPSPDQQQSADSPCESQLQQFLDSLRPKEREIVTLRAEGLSQKLIASLKGVTDRTIRNILSRVRQQAIRSGIHPPGRGSRTTVRRV
jgi:RNA polymerase sigma factor (sigma-70 family)